MSGPVCRVFSACVICVAVSGPAPAPALAHVNYLTDPQVFQAIQTANTIYVEVRASTWKPRGRLLWDAEADIRTKLTAVGFELVRENNQPHTLTLSGTYRETRGRSFAINRYGTVISGTFTVEHHVKGPLFEIVIQGDAVPTPSGTLPYLDSLHDFLTDPYYHFLGEIVDGQIHRNHDAHTVFLHALRASVVSDTAAAFSENAGSVYEHELHSMPQAHTLYTPLVARRTIVEFVQANDDAIIDILPDLLQYPDVYVKVRSVQAFGDFGVTEALPLLQDLEQHAEDIEVRNAASSTIVRLTEPSL